MKYIIILVFFLAGFTLADSYLLNGGQESVIAYEMVQKIFPDPGTKTVTVTCVVPQDFSSPTYNQKISNFSIKPSIQPASVEQLQDERGNSIRKFVWKPPFQPFDITISCKAENHVLLQELKMQSPFPVQLSTNKYRMYLGSTKQIPADDPLFIGRANELTRNAASQYEAVQAVLSWVIDHMTYVLVPPEYTAQYSMNTGKGNCQNYSHLAAALLRAVKIPTRIVNGITLKQPYEINVGKRNLRMSMAQGRHSWIEVYFPDYGWIPFDPQQTQLFVSNRFIRVEIGLDNEDTMDDGLIRWSRRRGSQAKVSFEEIINGSFVTDQIDISGEATKIGPRKLLLSPNVAGQKIPLPVIPEKKKEIIEKPQEGPFTKPFIMGNLEYPEGVNFIFTRETHETESGSMELRKNFLVETAEYVTSKLQYAQVFDLKETVHLESVGLVLHKFGGSGKLWIELREDNNGSPAAEVAVTSSKVDLKQMSSKPGYEWIDFSFKSQQLMLTPDRYWISLAYEGGPIVNWFYSYGKPVGPIDGTRYKARKEREFDNVLGYEFNYRVMGTAR